MDSYDFDIYKGATFSLSLSLKDASENPIDLTNYNISGFLKFRYSDATKLVSLNPTKTAPYTSGVITLTIPASGTEILPVGYSFYDVEIYHTGQNTVDKILIGKASVHPEVTY